MRIDVEMESLQREVLLLSDEAEPEPGDPPQGLTAGAKIGLETACLDSSSSTECSGDRIESGLSASVTRGRSSFVKWQPFTCL